MKLIEKMARESQKALGCNDRGFTYRLGYNRGAEAALKLLRERLANTALDAGTRAEYEGATKTCDLIDELLSEEVPE